MAVLGSLGSEIVAAALDHVPFFKGMINRKNVQFSFLHRLWGA